MNKLYFTDGIIVALTGVFLFLLPYFAVWRCQATWCLPGFNGAFHPEFLLTIPMGLALVIYSFRYKPRVSPPSPGSDS